MNGGTKTSVLFLEKRQVTEAKAQEFGAQLGAFKAALQDTKADQLQVQMQQLQAQLQEKEVALKQRDEQCQDQAKKIAELVKQMAEMEDHLNHSYNQTLESLYAGMLQAKEEKEQLAQQISTLEARLNEAKAAAAKAAAEKAAAPAPATNGAAAAAEAEMKRKIADLEFKLTESNRVSKFLQGSAAKAQEQKHFHEVKAQKLEGELAELQEQLQAQTKAAAANEHKSKEQTEKLNELLEQVR